MSDDARVQQMHDAARLWERNDRIVALDELMQLWRTWKSPRLGDVIAQLTQLAAAGRAPIRPGLSKSAAQLWREVERSKDVLDLPRLLESIPESISRLQLERTQALSAWPPHPLVQRTILGWWTAADRRLTAVAPVLADLVEAAADPIFENTLSSLMATVLLATRRVGRAHAKLLRSLAQVSRTWQAPNHTSSEHQALDGLFALVPGASPAQRTDDLFARVYAAPDDDALRALLADALVAKADPRGELISLQLLRSDKPTRAEKRLLAQWSDIWLGRLSPCFRRGVVFRRGFPSHGAYEKGGDPTWPEWATFESLDVEPASAFAGGGMDVLVSPRLTSLEAVVGLGASSLGPAPGHPSFFSLPTVAWRTLGLTMHRGFVPPLDQLVTAERFPRLEHLVLAVGPSWVSPEEAVLERVLALPVFARVRHLDTALLGLRSVQRLKNASLEMLTLRERSGLAVATFSEGQLTLRVGSELVRSAMPFLDWVLMLAEDRRPQAITVVGPKNAAKAAIVNAELTQRGVAQRLMNFPAKVSLPW
jgi:hypothetical protein